MHKGPEARLGQAWEPLPTSTPNLVTCSSSWPLSPGLLASPSLLGSTESSGVESSQSWPWCPAFIHSHALSHTRTCSFSHLLDPPQSSALQPGRPVQPLTLLPLLPGPNLRTVMGGSPESCHQSLFPFSRNCSSSSASCVEHSREHREDGAPQPPLLENSPPSPTL